MTSDAVAAHPSRPLLTLGQVHRLRVQVGYRARPDGPAYQHFLLDLPVPEGASGEQEGSLEPRVLATLEPVLYTDDGAPRHYSVHSHRWHTSWGASPGTLEIGLLVTTGAATRDPSSASFDSVTLAFDELLTLLGRPEPALTTRESALLRARRSAAATSSVDVHELSVSTEEHHPTENSWTVGLRTPAGEEYHVVVGFVDGYAGAVRVWHEEQVEVYDSLGAE